MSAGPLLRLVVMAVAAVLIGCQGSNDTRARPVQLDEPLTVSAAEVSMAGIWHLSVNSAGQAALHRSTRGQSEPRQFVIPPEDWAAFRKALTEERFFELGDKYGDELVVDTNENTLTVTAGSVTKVVRYYYLDPRIQHEPGSEVARALRVWDLVSDWLRFAE